MAPMNKILVSLLLAFAGYSVQNISQATQKLGLQTMEHNRARGSLIWGAATAGTGLSTLILLAAVSLGQVSLVGAMAGTGLVSMTLYSRVVLKHPVRKQEILGVSLILLSAVMIGALADEASQSMIEIRLLTTKLVLVSLAYGTLWVLFRKRQLSLCAALGGFAGALGGFVSQFQKISTSPPVEGGRMTGDFNGLASLWNPFTLLWILLSVGSMVVLQFAHKNGRPLRVIPLFSANFILIPVIGGVSCFGEELHPVQWAGVAAIIAGVLIITLRKDSQETV